jgi:hypothetical protein
MARKVPLSWVVSRPLLGLNRVIPWKQLKIHFSFFRAILMRAKLYYWLIPHKTKLNLFADAPETFDSETRNCLQQSAKNLTDESCGQGENVPRDDQRTVNARRVQKVYGIYWAGRTKACPNYGRGWINGSQARGTGTATQHTINGRRSGWKGFYPRERRSL